VNFIFYAEKINFLGVKFKFHGVKIIFHAVKPLVSRFDAAVKP